MKTGILLGTFLPVHKGHELLMRFAAEYMAGQGGNLCVILSSRSREPIDGEDRLGALHNISSEYDNVFFFHHSDDDAPQNPNGDNDTEFWDYWKDVISVAVFGKSVEYVFSSEKYGDKIAEIFDAEHVVFDAGRLNHPVSGTMIRNEPLANYNDINIHMARYLKKQFVFFGAESVGKSTFTDILNERFDASSRTIEYARPYLMSLDDKTVTEAVMDAIFKGQYALEKANEKSLDGKIVNFMDTDILSTFGYAHMIKMDVEPYLHMLPKKERIYIILAQDEVPFEQDEIRYGDGVRESGDQYWVEILEHYGIDMNNVYVVRGDKNEREMKIVDIVTKEVKKQFHFERE